MAMKDIKEKEKKAKEIASSSTEFKGYTIEEIKFQRALIAMEASFCKAKALRSFDNLQNFNPFAGGNSKASLPGKAGAIALKMVNGLNYLDYIMLGLSLFKGTKKVMSFFRGKKK